MKKALIAAALVLWPTAATEPPLQPLPAYQPIEFVEVKLEKPLEVKRAPDPVPEPVQIYSREEWLAQLEICESGGDITAINPIDKDGTASHGLLQFKDTTFEMYRLRYGLGEVELYDPEAQRTMVRLMMDDHRVNWEREFPDCVRKLGRPPAGK